VLVEERLPSDWDYKQFWSSYRTFFLVHGYTLYDIDTTDADFTMGIPPFPRQQGENPPHLYACFHANSMDCQCVDKPAVNQLAMSHQTDVYFLLQKHVIFAQDALKRDVAIKIIRTDSNEEHIHDFVLRRLQSFKGVLPTIEIIRSPHDFSFVVTPRCL
jgi:hypothetical protein